MEGIKALGKDEAGNLLPFTANGKRYIPMHPEAKMSVGIWRHYEKFRMVLGTGRNFGQLIEALQDIENELGADKPFPEIRVASILKINTIKRGVVEMTAERHNIGLYMATLMIRREGDSWTEWSMEMADEYIADWKDVAIDDLFFFALARTTGFKQTFQRVNEELTRRTGEQGGT